MCVGDMSVCRKGISYGGRSRTYGIFCVAKWFRSSSVLHGLFLCTFLYVKFLVVWALVLLADFILEFRFEYLWPFWLLLRSVYDSFKYQGLAFSVFFVFIAFTSDMICLLFIPVHWLFFAASTYVWVQYVWHTERGICLPTISLWLLFVYIEASVRLKELKNLPFHLDLCRPFAAHCIGYPVVTLGFGFKSYVGYRMRLRKQKEVAKENEFYIQLLQQALPPEAPSIANLCSQDKEKASKSTEEVISNGHCVTANHGHGRKSICSGSSVSNSTNLNNQNSLTPAIAESKSSSYSELDSRESRKHNAIPMDKHDYQYMETQIVKQTNSVNHDFDDSDESCEREKAIFKSNGVACLTTSLSQTRGKWNPNSVKDNLTSLHTSNSKRSRNSSKEISANSLNSQKDDHTYRLEADIKRLKADLQSSRQSEQDLRSQVHSISVGERSIKSELLQLQQDNESLQHKLHSMVTARQQDKQTIANLEKRVQEERKMRTLYENQLATERKAKKAEEAAAARAVAMATARIECTENCKSRRRDMENEIKQLRRDLKIREEKLQQMERQAQENIGSTQALVSALNAMEEKNARLENSLSAETRLKLDLFSALGEAKRQLEISQSLLAQRDKEVDELKSKVAEVMAVMPVTTNPGCYPPSHSPTISLSQGMIVSSLFCSPKYNNSMDVAVVSKNNPFGEEKVSKSNLDPNASVYTPKVARLGSSESDI
ncbi:macoilin-1-like isoform X2 [Uloborus diversus]|uniref:macoilin-1-like isoform X2 n=1 Tax=Uloborus diversus TaxID=327109 RepID=UPI002409F274|nr:macoilin-1-like isoform X2 [Uloborus diversus]